MAEPESLKIDDATFAEVFADLFDVVQRGVRRRATAADLLELFEPRYVLKLGERYLGAKGWRRKQREAHVLGHVEDARRAREIARKEYEQEARIVRVRRRGTMGIEGYAMREGLEVSERGGDLAFGVGKGEAEGMLAKLAERVTRGMAKV